MRFKPDAVELNPLPSPYGATILYVPPTPSAAELARTAVQKSLPSDTTLYKYLSSEYGHALLRGNTRIGTLYDFRRIELGKGIADPDEGRKTLVHIVHDRTYVGGTEAAEAMAEMGFSIGSGGPVRFQSLNFERRVDHPDMFVWCCSASFDTGVMAALDGAELCIEVTEAGGFFSAMTDCLNSKRKVKFLGFREVAYLPRRQKWNEQNLGESAAFLKEPGAYGAQYEVRAAWLPLDGEPIEPLIIECPELGAHCRHLSFE